MMHCAAWPSYHLLRNWVGSSLQSGGEHSRDRRQAISVFIHYVNDSRIFGRNSNGKVRFGSVSSDRNIRDQNLEVVHLFRSNHSDQTSPFHFWQTGFRQELGNGIKNGKIRFNKKMSFHWPLTGRFGIMESILSLFGSSGASCLHFSHTFHQ